MVKSYLRYEPYKTFGVIASASSNVVFSGNDKFAIAPALEDVAIWDLKKGTLIGKWHDNDNKSEVTIIAKNPNKVDYAVGYADGSIRIWNIERSSTSIIFNGHRGAVTALTFDKTGTRLASGSRDTDLIIWDVVGEVGLYRMRGHKDQITAIRFLPRPLSGGHKSNDTISSSGYLLSSSKDTLLKLWDLSTQHCMETVVAHRSEIWDFDISKDEKMLVTGSDDTEFKVWTIDHEVLAKGLEIDDSAKEEEKEMKKSIQFFGNVKRQGKDRVVTIKFHPNASLLGVQGPEKSVEIYRIRTHEEIKKKLTRRKKRQKEKQHKTGVKGQDENDPMEVEEQPIRAEDLITPYQIIRTDGKVRSFDFSTIEDNSKASSIQVLTSLTNNMLEVYTINLLNKKTKDVIIPSKLYSIDLSGHRNDIRTLSLSTDDNLLCSASKDTIKIWNMQTTSCIRTMECGYALCSAFLQDNRYVIIGTKSGHLELFDIASASLTESIEAHDKAIWSLQVRPDKKGLITGSADTNVKFWDFDTVEEKPQGEDGVDFPVSRRLTLVHTRTLKMSDDVLFVRYSPNQKLIAVALLDATVKVFYNDTLKFFLSLYGHKLPVLSMDISSDNKLIVTGSADKNIKIWGLDFGDCHKSIFAHQDSIMYVQFVADTHYIFTASKDKLIKYWDGDKFENIMKLEGHHGEVWALAISKRGDLLISGSHDRSIRVWEQTDEPLFLEEEREKELEELYESTLTTSMEKTNLEDNAVEVSSAGKQTMETLKAGERIMEALDIADENAASWATYNEVLKERGNDPGPPPKPNPILVALGNLTGDQYVLRIIEKVKSTELEEALLVLPFTKVISLLKYLDVWAEKEINITLTCRILFYLLKVHHNQIVANRLMRPRLDSLRAHVRTALKHQKDLLGYNLAALKYIKRDWEANSTSEFFDPSLDNEELDDSSKKRKFINIIS
ncbi:WD40-repeat-containing domain protein [Glomus cerebriforme]|uniref:WD40-repeat-containing domain protein n=1 Tax=Glomus cerebriforme TaxID=658196 RepID=A0A397T6M0_9GLOM|nr:WD40-repeat-containing domain protein [Glomus cerebriforme]